VDNQPFLFDDHAREANAWLPRVKPSSEHAPREMCIGLDLGPLPRQHRNAFATDS